MLGLVFSEFMDIVEESFPDDVYDALLETAEEQCESKGAYTSVGHYDHLEMVTLITALSEKTGIPLAELIRVAGNHLFKRFHQRYPDFFNGVDDAFDFLRGIEDRIHFEVRKLYPHAELPYFEYTEPSENELVLTYQSKRPFAHLAWGLIEGCITHFDQSISVAYKDLSDGAWTRASFHLRRD